MKHINDFINKDTKQEPLNESFPFKLVLTVADIILLKELNKLIDNIRSKNYQQQQIQYAITSTINDYENNVPTNANKLVELTDALYALLINGKSWVKTDKLIDKLSDMLINVYHKMIH